MKIQVEIKNHNKNKDEVLWFYSWDNNYKYCLGCIYNYTYERDDFKWLFDFIVNLNWKFNKFSNCDIKETEERWEDWLDSYCNKTIIHSFPNLKDIKFITHLNDMSESENCNLEDVFNFLSRNTGIKFKIKRY